MNKLITRIIFLISIIFCIVGAPKAAFSQADCAIVDWTFSPPPVNNTYYSGQTVHVCITVSYYQMTGSNWLHGIVLNFPSGWDMNTITNISTPPPCGNASGSWDYYLSCTGTGSGDTFGPGFYFDGNTGGPDDNNPGNNYGDFCSDFGPNFTFCFDISTVADCGGSGNPLDDSYLSPSITITGDGISGSYYSPSADCALSTHDANINNSNIFTNLTLDCCDAEAGISPGIINICETGTFDLIGELISPSNSPVDSGGYWTYDGPQQWIVNGDSIWVDDSDTLGYGTFDPTTDPAGDYTYHIQLITGIDTCESTSTITMQFIDYGIVQNVAYCETDSVALNDLCTEFPVPSGGDWYFNYDSTQYIDYESAQVIEPNGIIDPNINFPGIYTYEYYDPGNCKTIFSIDITFATGGAAGCPSTVEVCTSDLACFSPFDALGCNPTAGGNWIVYGYDPISGTDIFLDYMPLFDVCVSIDSLLTEYAPYEGDLKFQYVLGAPPCAPAFVDVNVEVYVPANTGDYTTTSICVDDAPLILETLLDGVVDPGLTWTEPVSGDTIPSLFDPGTITPGTTLSFLYSGGLLGTTCHNATLLELTVLPNFAFAGEDNTITVCESDPYFLMNDSLLPNPVTGILPQTGGNWLDPSSSFDPGDYFVPGSMPSGVYHYNVTSTCATDDAYLTINVLPAPVAGTDGIFDICDNEIGVPLSDGLGAPFDSGGDWYMGGVLLSNNTIDGNTVIDGTVYTYVVGTAPCLDTATVTINLLNAPDAGVLTTVPQQYCASDAPFSLMSLFTTNPSVMNPNYWTGPSVPTLDPSMGASASGTYTYSIPDLNGCGTVSVSINITVTPLGDPGTDASTTFCETMGNVDLTSYLGGNPDANGTWSDPSGTFNPVPNPFDISGLCGGSYTFNYTVGAGLCAASSQLTFDVICEPNAGSDGSLTLCSDGANFSLFDGLVGPYDTPGTWENSTGSTPSDATNMDPATLGSGDTFTYTVTGSPCTPDEATVVVNITPALVATNIVTACTPSQTTYIVSFDIAGGQGSYTWVSGNTGTITGSTFTSDPITAGTPFSVEIAGGATCANLIVSGVSPTCLCTVNASFTSTDQTICIGGSIDLTVSLSGGVPGNTYTVDYDDGSSSQSVNNLNNGDILVTVSPTTTTTYTLTGVTDGACVGTAIGSVTITVEPVQNAGGDHTVAYCGDGTVLNLIDAVTSQGEPAGGSFNPSQITLIPANSGTYTYTMDMPGSTCPADLATYTINIEPQLATSGVQTTCSASQTEYTVTFNITGGTGVGTYTVDNSTISGSTFTSAPIPLPDANGYSFQIDDGGSCGPITVSGSAPNCNCPVSASFGSANQTICIGSSTDIVINLNGGTDGTYNATYEANGVDMGLINGGGLSNGDLLTVSPTVTTTYVLTSVEDGNCTGSVSGSVTITVEALANAGGDHTVAYCGDGSLLNLFDAVNNQNEPSGGSFAQNPITLIPANTGTYTYTMSGNVCPDDQANYTINIQEELIATNVTAVCEPNQTEYTVEFTIEGGTPPYTISGGNGTLLGSNFSETRDFALNPTYDYIISDNGPCPDVVVSGIAPDCNCIAQGSITGSSTICLGECATLTFDLIGDGPFSVKYTNGNSGTTTTLDGILDGHQVTVCPTVANTYTLIEMSDTYCDGVVTGNSVSIDVDNPFTITNITEICDNTAETYQVQFAINGGAPPYIINGANGVYNTSSDPNLFVSNPIPSGNGYSIDVSDGGVCPAQTVSSPGYSCACISEAGSIPATPIEVCAGSAFSISTSGSETIDGNDIIQYILHDGSINTIGSIIATSPDGTFTFNYPSMVPGVVYYINAVVGNDLGNGNVNLNGTCTSISNGASVVLNALPTAMVSGGATVCAGEPVDLNIVFTGEGPWDFSYSVDGIDQGSPSYSSTDEFTLTATQPGEYVIETVSDNNCSGTTTGTATIQNFVTPTAILSGSPEVCENSGDGPQVALSGDGPWTFVYSIDGVNQPPVTTNSPVYTIPAEVEGDYALVSLEGANCSGTVSGSQNISLLARPTATITGGGSVCAGETATFDVVLTGVAPWTVQYTVDGVPQDPLTNLTGNYAFESSLDGDYVIVSVSDDNCAGEILASQASLNVTPLPTAEITSSVNSVCIGQEVDLGVDLTGVPPYTLTYVLNNDTITVTGLYGDYTQTLEPEAPVTFEVLYVEDGSTPACSSNPNEYRFIDANVLPNAPVLGSDTICEDNGPVLIGVSSAPGLSYTWSPTDNLSDPSLSNPIYTPIIQGHSAKTFSYILTASNGECSALDTMFITVDPGPLAKFVYAPNPVKNVDPVVHFTNTSIAPQQTNYFWIFDTLGTSTELNPTYKFPDEVNSEYKIELTAIDPTTGCMDVYTEVIVIKPEMLVYVPSAFTPDGDGLNDLWGPVMSNVDPNEYQLTVFNRLGQIVFMTHDINKKWNGNTNGDSYFVEGGVYVWMIETKNEISLEEVTLKGQVTVVR